MEEALEVAPPPVPRLSCFPKQGLFKTQRSREGNPAAVVVSTLRTVNQLFAGRRCSHLAT